jgi:predicted regulator of Ras-like GTPase activity (Roadblock/LC7/MglB family)
VRQLKPFLQPQNTPFVKWRVGLSKKEDAKMMFRNSPVPETAQALSKILADLQEDPQVLYAILSTADGIPVDMTLSKANQLSAVAGFLLASAQQACTMLGLTDAAEVVVASQQGPVLVARPFTVAQTRVILTVIFAHETAYRRLLNTAVRSVQAVMET